MAHWERLIQLDTSWVSKELENHFCEIQGKLNVRLYTVKASGTQILPDALVQTLYEMLPDYVYGKSKIMELGERRATQQANRFFGKKDPMTEGKYGEILLFALVESVLGAKMVAHKIRSLSNFKDQVKGGDGIFLGDYQISDGRIEQAYFIGESKVMETYSTAVTSAFDSLRRFHEDANSIEFRTTELIVAKENLMLDDEIDIDELYERLTPTSERFKEQILVHPILIMYDDNAIKKCQNKNSATKSDLENAIKERMQRKKNRLIRHINEKLETYPDVSQVYLDFFLVPFISVDKFRDAMYYSIHSVSFQKKP